MRCRRCHTTLSPGKKTCPVCGTLVLKRRGSVRLSTAAGGSVLDNFLYRFDMRKILLAVIALAAAAGIVYMFASGCVSCEGCTACSSCASCASCNSCASCASCFSCAEKEIKSKSLSLNSSKMCDMYYHNGTLFYAADGSLVAMNDNGDSAAIAAGVNPGDVCADDAYVYYRDGSSIWRTPQEKPMTTEDDPYASVCLLSTEGEDAAVSRIDGFTVYNGVMVYWGVGENGEYSIRSRMTEGSADERLYSGALANIQSYKGYLYFSSRAEEESGFIYRVSILNGAVERVTDYPVGHYALCADSLYACRYMDGKDALLRIGIDADNMGKILSRWIIGKIDGMFANDSYIYYYINTESEGGDIFRMQPGETKAKRVFYDDSIIMMTGVSGDFFSVYTDLGETAEERYTNAAHYIFNSAKQEQIYCEK